ncbi:MAG: glycosyltransferase family 1 protein [Bacteroidetes bacterium]|nr:MAG: glycosyltransferase family 1 protein [Bacteroidota bacterium]
MNNHLHVISFDNPYPPNYGGVIDVFYKLKALQQAAVKVTLHVFEYGRNRNPILEEICDTVHYYPRRTFVNPFSGTLPYIVSTRNDVQLLQNLLADEAPILFEGLHACFFLNHPDLANRKKLVRMHNVEHDYYRKLEDVEGNFFKKYFFSKEADRLEKFESVLTHATVIFAISPNDKKTLEARYQRVELLPAFHANTQLTTRCGQGNFAFYHGNLSVGENDEAAKFLVTQVFNRLQYPLIIAGNNPSSTLKKLVEGHTHISLLQNVSTEKITELTQQAHINVLPTFQNTGIKLKLINVLFQGRWVLANNTMVENTGLENLCVVANTAEDMRLEITRLINQPITENDLAERSQLLNKMFGNQQNIRILINNL